jgi:hypothetical protein
MKQDSIHNWTCKDSSILTNTIYEQNIDSNEEWNLHP